MGRFDYDIDKDRIEEAKERRARLRSHQKNDRIPFTFGVGGIPGKYTWGEKVRDTDKAIEDYLYGLTMQTKAFPDCDRIPFMPMDFLGEGLIPSMFGAKQYIVEEVFPFTEGRVIQNLEEDLHKLKERINPEKDGWGPKLKACVERFLEVTKGEIPVGICDVQSPYGVATKLLGNEEMIFAMYDAPELFDRLLTICTDAIIDTVKAMEKWTGGNLVKNYTDPGDDSIILFDDYISVITPSLHEEHCLKHNLRLYQEFGKGHLHTCGPNFPGYIDSIVMHKPKSMDLIILSGFGRTRKDMLKMKDIALENNIFLQGSLTAFPTHINDSQDIVAPDFEFVQAMNRNGGLLWNEGGTYEQGLKWLEIAKTAGE